MNAMITALPRRRGYPSDTTDTEWELLAPLLPPAASTTVTGGHPEAHPRREVVDAIRKRCCRVAGSWSGRSPG
jgi:transposase